jgi:hypothetical protein
MTNVPLTTEGRIFAKQVWRQIKAREPVDATLFAGKQTSTWWEAIVPIFERCHKLDPTPFDQHVMKSAIKRLEKVPLQQLHFLLANGPHLITMVASENHTLTVMDGEHEAAIVIQAHSFPQGLMGVVVCNVSDHALGRLYERINDGKPTVQNGVTFALACGRIGNMIASTEHLIHSEINMSLGHGVVAVGNVKLSTQGGQKWATAWFDCRTVLLEEHCGPEQLAQASLLNDVLLDRARITEVPHIPMRMDYVMQVLDASRKPRN